MPAEKLIRNLKQDISRAIQREAFRLARWASKNSYIYRKGRWRKIGDPNPVTEEEMWRRYEAKR